MEVFTAFSQTIYDARAKSEGLIEIRLEAAGDGERHQQ